MVFDRKAGRVVYELDINDEGNIHDVFLETQTGRFEVSGHHELIVDAVLPRLLEIRPVTFRRVSLRTNP